MTGRDFRVAVIAGGVGLMVVIVLGGIGLAMRATMQTSGGGGPRDGDLIAIPTAEPVVADEGTVCLDAANGGRLAAHPQWGIAVVSGGSGPQRMIWPNGYVARIAGDRLELLDGEGEVVARTGDHIQVGGGETTIGGVQGWIVCPAGIKVEPVWP